MRRKDSHSRNIKIFCLVNFFAYTTLSITVNAQTSSGESRFCTHLPIVIASLTKDPFPVVDMKNQLASKEKRPVILKIFDANPHDDPNGQINCISDKSAEIKAMMNYRGASSLGFPKHQYGVKLTEEWSVSENSSLKTNNFLGMPYGGKSWVFSAEQPNLDGTYLRNSLSFYLQNQFNGLAKPANKIWGPRTRFFELFIQNPGGAPPEYAVCMWLQKKLNSTKIELV